MELFSLSHFLTLVAIALIAFICIYAGRKGSAWPRVMLAFFCLAIFPINQLALMTLDFKIALNNIIPFHLCDLAALTAGFGLLTQKPLLCELTYCWGIAGTMQGLIFPNLLWDFPYPMYWSFFIQHGVIVIVALYLPLALKWRPSPGVVPRVIFWNQIYFISAIALNTTLGTNFGFLASKPLVASPLDYLGDWPVYLIWLQVIAAVIMICLLLPFSRTINIWRFRGIGVSPTHE
ncbi:TIGR02206 family membrane protein [bacterium]|nr:TIGR02206 family membrane protein [bacterium]